MKPPPLHPSLSHFPSPPQNPPPPKKPPKKKFTYRIILRLFNADNFAVHGDIIVSDGEMYAFWALLISTPLALSLLSFLFGCGAGLVLKRGNEGEKKKGRKDEKRDEGIEREKRERQHTPHVPLPLPLTSSRAFCGGILFLLPALLPRPRPGCGCGVPRPRLSSCHRVWMWVWRRAGMKKGKGKRCLGQGGLGPLWKLWLWVGELFDLGMSKKRRRW